MQSLLLAAAADGLGETAAGGVEKIIALAAIPLLGIGGVVAILFLLKKLAKLYYKVPPNKALVVFGRGKTQTITGGAKLLIPFFNDWFEMDLSAFQVNLDLKNAPNRDRVPINVKAVATVAIGGSEELLSSAASRFGEKDPSVIRETAHGVLDGQFRQVISATDMETILTDRQKFNQVTQDTAGKELGHLGFTLLMLNIQEVTDPNGYIEAQGKPKIAEVKAAAEIATAVQTRRQTIEVTDAQREASKTAANNEAQIADAQRDLNKKKAIYDAEVATERAKAEQAGPLATAQASQGVRVANVEAEEAETQARIKLQDSVAALNQAELNATVIKKAEADANAAKITADGVKTRELIEAEAQGQARNIAAEAGAKAAAKEAEAQAAQIRTVGTAQAEMTTKTGQANADAKKANLLAEAEGQTATAAATKALLLAQADGKTAEAKAVEALLMAQARGTAELNKAYEGLSPEAQRLFALKTLVEAGPGLITALGEAGAKVMTPYAQSITAALGAIDNLTVYDVGGGQPGSNSLSRVAGIVPDAGHFLNVLKGSPLFPIVNAWLIKNANVDLNAAIGSTITEVVSAETTAITGTPKGGGNGDVDKKVGTPARS